MTLEPGQIIDGKYRIVRLIGEGGMGSVFEGENTFIARRVAIKVLHAAAAANAQVLTRFEREAQAAGRIGSDHILEILDLGRLENSDRYMVMEFLDGEVLSDRIARRGTLTPAEAYPLIRQTLVGLGAAHGAGIVHRDLKPDNIFILREKAGHKDFVKIIDFGISKFNALSGDMSMTTTGAVMGTPYYMSPEQAKGGTVDARTDIYAIGVILFEALTGSVPFSGTSFNDLMFKIVLSDIPPIPDEIDPNFVAIVRKAMARDVNERFQTTAEFLEALEEWAGSAGLGTTMAAGEVRPKQQTLDAMPRDAAKAATAANWAATQGDAETLPKKKFPLPMIAAAVAVLAIGGGALAMLGGSKADPTSSAAVPEPAKAEPAKAEPANVEAVKAEPTKTEPAKADPAANPAPAPIEAKPPATSAPVQAKPAATKPGAAAQAKPVAAKPATPVAKPADKPATKPSTKPGGPDFGY